MLLVWKFEFGPAREVALSGAEGGPEEDGSGEGPKILLFGPSYGSFFLSRGTTVAPKGPTPPRLPHVASLGSCGSAPPKLFF